MKLSCKLSQCHRKICNGDRLVHPIAAANNESEALAEGSLGVHVPATRAREHSGKLAYGTAAQQRVDATHEPDRKGQPRRAHVSGDFTRSPQDATSDGGPDTDGYPKADSEYSQQSAAAPPSVSDVCSSGHQCSS
jgi:hypothetical protein